MGQTIQEWTKWNLQKAAFKKFEVIWSAKADEKVCFISFRCHFLSFQFFLKSFNPLQSGVASLYPLKTSENLKFFCFQVL